MTTLEFKRSLTQQIEDIDDLSILKAVKSILDSMNQSQVLKLSEEQLSEINSSKLDYNQGLYVNEQELDIEFNKWLGVK
jgi:hypothetical protein